MAQQTNNPSTTECDLLVIGSGAGGLSAAVTAAQLGLEVVVAEKEAVYGGTTAWSGGWMWIPHNPPAEAAGIREDARLPLQYLRHELGPMFNPDSVAALLAQGPRMLRFFENHTALRFIDGNAMPDFHGRTPGAATGGRSVCAAPFNGRELGPRLNDLRPPLDLISLWGMGIASGADLRHFLNATRSARSFLYVTGRVLRHLKDRLLHGRGRHLVNGNALAARLAKSAFDLGVPLRTRSPARRLVVRQGRVCGAVLGSAHGDVEVIARKGVVLACGGFPHDPERIGNLFGHAPTGREHWSAAPPGNTGDGLKLGEAAGGVVATDLAAAGAWAPVSLVPRRDGSVGAYPHLIDRAKPGLIAVLANGQRFTNEADSYHDFMASLLRATPAGETVQAWLLCDHRFIRRFGLGAAKPAPMPLGLLQRNGYLRRGRSIEALAQACGIAPAALAATVAEYNQHARDGADPAFGRGDTPFNRVQGDPDQTPNPNVAPIEQGPFYAVKVVPGSLGTFAGLRTDASARVLNAAGRPVPGLYACGNDMNSVMGGHYPAGGITLGPAMTFGYIAAHHAAGVALDGAG